MISFLLILFTIALFTEGMLTTIPLTLIALIILLLQKREEWIFLLAFLSGLILDLMTFQILGKTSIFFVLFLFFILLYEKKYEIQTLPFVVVSSFFGTFAYLMYTGATNILWQAVISSIIGGILFALYKMQRKRYQVTTSF